MSQKRPSCVPGRNVGGSRAQKPQDANPDADIPKQCPKAYRSFPTTNLKDFFGLSPCHMGTESRKERIPCAKSISARELNAKDSAPEQLNPRARAGLARTQFNSQSVQKWAHSCTKQSYNVAVYRKRAFLVQTVLHPSHCIVQKSALSCTEQLKMSDCT